MSPARRRRAAWGIATLAALCLAGPAEARPGRLDGAFAGDGWRTLPSGITSVRALALGGDRRIALTGPEAHGRLVVAQLSRDGARDKVFDGNGVAGVRLPGRAPEGGVGVAIFRDNRVVVAATLQPRATGAPTRIVVARLLADGSVDPSFGRGGIATVGPPGARADALELTFDGMVVIGGAVATPAGEVPLLARLLPDGTPDAGFAGSGTVVLPGTGRVRDLAVLRDLRVAAAIGADPALDATDGMRVARVTPLGALDPTFAGTGLAEPAATGAMGRALGPAAVLLAPDGTVTVGGNSLTPQRAVMPVVARLGPDGAPSATFGLAGVQRLPRGRGVRLTALAADHFGRLLLGGRTATPRAELQRLLTNGRPDRRFRARKPLGAVAKRATSQVTAVLPRGRRVVVAGIVADGARPSVRVARLVG